MNILFPIKGQKERAEGKEKLEDEGLVRPRELEKMLPAY